MTLETWLFFCATETVLCFIPGPAVLCVVSSALTRGARSGFHSSLGILAANTMYFVLSAMGLGAVLLASRAVFIVIKSVGAAYLVFLGLRMVFARPEPESAAAKTETTPRGSFWNGFVVQAANPKAIIFFTALLPQFIDPDAAMTTQVGILAVSSIVIELAVLSIYVAACHNARRWFRGGRLGVVLQRVGGGLLIVAGARLAAMRNA
jgi:threonine/homoserine/homoserine lactone efflux protein